MLDLLKQSGLTKAQLADRLGIASGTVYGWSELPRYAEAYLELYIENKEAREYIQAHHSFFHKHQAI